MAFVESGEAFERYPETKEYNFVIRIYARYRYTEYGEAFLGKAEEIVMKTGYGFQYIYKPYEEGDNLAKKTFKSHSHELWLLLCSIYKFP